MKIIGQLLADSTPTPTERVGYQDWGECRPPLLTWWSSHWEYLTKHSFLEISRFISFTLVLQAVWDQSRTVNFIWKKTVREINVLVDLWNIISVVSLLEMFNNRHVTYLHIWLKIMNWKIFLPERKINIKQTAESRKYF